MAKKPKWAIEKEQNQKAAQSVWLFGLHAVRDAIQNPKRVKKELWLTPNAANRLQDELDRAAPHNFEIKILEPRKFNPPIDKDSVHQGAALLVEPLNWGQLPEQYSRVAKPLLVLLDRVTDPHNVGAILRSAEVFGAHAVVAPTRHSAPETGALAKTACGALERQPYIRIKNLGDTIETLKNEGFYVIGLDGTATGTIGHELKASQTRPLALVMGAEGPGLRARTKDLCDSLAKIEFAGEFGSLNVSNAAAVALYAAAESRKS